jgi:hypothetical protein
MEAQKFVRRRGSHVFYTVVSQTAVRLSALCDGRPLLPGRFLVRFSASGWVNICGHSAVRRIKSTEKLNDLIWNRTRDLPVCIIVPQPNMLSCAQSVYQPTTGWAAVVRLPVRVRISSISSRPVLGLSQPPIQWVTGTLSWRVKWPGREADHSPPTCAEVKKMWICTSTPPYSFMA